MLRRFIILIAFAVATPLWGAEPAKNQIDLATRKVIVFKDGYCLFHKHGVAATDKQSEYFTDDVPDSAVLGSFWALPKEGRLVSMRAGWDTVRTSVTKEAPAISYLDILLANQGKRVRLEMNDKETVSGLIHQVITQPTSEGLSPALAVSRAPLSRFSFASPPAWSKWA